MSADSQRPQDAARPDPDVVRRVEDLLADRAAQGLSLEDERELQQLLAQAGDVDPESFDRAAAALDLALGPQEFEPMPAALAERIAAGRTAHSSELRSERHSAIAENARGTRGGPPSAPRSTFVIWSGWITAAAAIVATLFLARPSSGPGPEAPPAAPSIVELLNDAKDRLSLRWKATEDPASKDVRGNIEWSNALQKGYMRFAGLPKNDASKQQYQLWIFDKNQDERYPIDGGVFDIDVETGQVLVPIDAKIRVGEAAMFAVTIEKPGGVVVSKRDRLVAIAR